MNQPLSKWAVVLALLAAPAVPFAADSERTVKEVKFTKGSSTATLKGRITGYNYVDYQLRAGAGQKIQASMQASNRASYLNLLPPGSADAAMYVGSTGDNRFEGLLPDDGVYTMRVYLMRSEARRKHSSDYTLKVSVTGKALRALPARADALVPGTRFHATTKVSCTLQSAQVRECEAGVVRRGRDGTATVELAWDKTGKRRILFVKGKPEAADAPQPMTYTRDEHGWRITFGSDEHFEVPEPLVMGG